MATKATRDNTTSSVITTQLNYEELHCVVDEQCPIAIPQSGDKEIHEKLHYIFNNNNKIRIHIAAATPMITEDKELLELTKLVLH